MMLVAIDIILAGDALGLGDASGDAMTRQQPTPDFAIDSAGQS